MGSIYLRSQRTMKNIICSSLILLCFLSYLTEAIFFGPIAIGLGIGILAAKKGFLLGTALAGSRTRRSYQPSNYRYTPSHHYDSSYNSWYRDMTEMDQDGCGKKLICELRAKEKSTVGFTEDERLIAENFGSGTQVDVSDITVEYDLAAQLGKYMGLTRCQQLYNRCDLSSEDMVRMIKTEMDNVERMKRDLETEEVEVEIIERKEAEDTKSEFRNIQESEDDGNSWVWT